MVTKLTKALEKLTSSNEKDAAILTAINKKYTGCEPAASDDYDSIREMISALYGEEFYTKKN